MTSRLSSPGAEPWSHDGAGPAGALCIHGFTGNPSSMRGVAEAFAAAGFSVELPRLPGHGTTVEDMMTTGWADWTGEAEAAYQRLAAADRVGRRRRPVDGRLADAVDRRRSTPRSPGIVCINPATQPQPAEVMEMVHGMIDEGTDVMPGIGSDIADPDVVETAYDGTPLRAAASRSIAGIADLAPTLPVDPLPAAADDVAAGPRRRPGAVRLPGRALRRTGRAGHARAQLPRRDAWTTTRS